MLQLIRKLAEGEKTDPEIDSRLIECLTQCCKHEEKQIFELGFLVTKIIAENNPDIIL